MRQTKRQADQPADNLARSLPFSAPCSISDEAFCFAMCILRFVFYLLLLQHGFIDEKSTCFSCFALQFCIYIVLSKIKKSARNLRFCALLPEYMISAWRTCGARRAAFRPYWKFFDCHFPFDILGFLPFRFSVVLFLNPTKIGAFYSSVSSSSL